MTIFCELNPGMGLGNQLWNIYATLGIANSLGQSHCVARYENFKGKGFLELNTNLKFGGVGKLRECQEATFYNRKEKFHFNLYDESLYESAARGDDCVIKGLLQDEQYLPEDLPLQFTGVTRDLSSPNTIFCNIRGGEYRMHRRFQLDKNYWLNAMSVMAGDSPFTAVAVTDDPEYALSLYPFQFVVGNSIEESFATLVTATRVICSNSTFGYWPLRLGTPPEEAIAPAFFNRPYSNFWASPQNYYQGYTYLTTEGRTLSSESCLQYIRESSSKALDVSMRAPDKEIHGPLTWLKRILPRRFKERIKKVLTKLMGW